MYSVNLNIYIITVANERIVKDALISFMLNLACWLVYSSKPLRNETLYIYKHIYLYLRSCQRNMDCLCLGVSFFMYQDWESEE